MAFPTFEGGFFQVTALSFSPSVVAVGETARMSITIKNISGRNITQCYVEQDGRYPATNSQYGGYFPSQFLFGGGGSSGWDMKAISWANNSTQTFTGTVSFAEGNYHLDRTNYVLDPAKTCVHLSIVTNATFSNGTNYDNIYIRPGTGYLSVLSTRDNPKITLEIERTPNDEATAVKATARLTADCTRAVLIDHNYSLHLYATNAHNPALPTDEAIPFNATLDDLLSGITESTGAIATSFSNGTDWYFLLSYSNGYETANAYASIPRAFANVHLAGAASGGVAFGKFSASTEGNPLFECEYPAIFNGGINKGAVSVVNITGINSNFRLYYSGEYPRVIRMGNVVFLEGILSPTKTLTMTGTGNQYTMFTIPEGYRPARELTVVCHASSVYVWMLRIGTNGACILERHVRGETYVAPGAGNWLPFHAMWIIP